MKEAVKHIADLLVQLHGIDISKFDELFLNKVLQGRMNEIHCGTTEEYGILLEHNYNEGKTFVDSLHINYSEFFRNPLTFAVLENIILPAIVLKIKKTKRQEIRIWSAACAGGQEAYSLAILFEELRNRDEKIRYRIFATDQSEALINEAEKRQYPATALNKLNLMRAKQWFSKQGDTYSVKPELSANIDFSVFDLVGGHLTCPSSSIFGDFDLIVCANLLFYYKPEFRKIILEKMTGSLAERGYLITGEAEREILMKNGYHEVFPQSAIFQR